MRLDGTVSRLKIEHGRLRPTWPAYAVRKFQVTGAGRLFPFVSAP